MSLLMCVFKQVASVISYPTVIIFLFTLKAIYKLADHKV